tara:strand:- start:135 stop:623 length:489 start_codon:yes stop_codon:yes gene_type:complete
VVALEQSEHVLLIRQTKMEALVEEVDMVEVVERLNNQLNQEIQALTDLEAQAEVQVKQDQEKVVQVEVVLVAQVVQAEFPQQQQVALEVLVKLTQSQMVQLQYFMLEVAVELQVVQERVVLEVKVEELLVVDHLVRKMLQQIEVVALVEQEVTNRQVLVEKE